MKVLLRMNRSNVEAVGEFDPKTRALIVKKGSAVSQDVSTSRSFRGGDTIIKLRKEYVEKGVVVEDVAFKSPSTAANFITGRSTNGLIAWRNSKGQTIKEILS